MLHRLRRLDVPCRKQEGVGFHPIFDNPVFIEETLLKLTSTASASEIKEHLHLNASRLEDVIIGWLKRSQEADRGRFKSSERMSLRKFQSLSSRDIPQGFGENAKTELARLLETDRLAHNEVWKSNVKDVSQYLSVLGKKRSHVGMACFVAAAHLLDKAIYLIDESKSGSPSDISGERDSPEVTSFKPGSYGIVPGGTSQLCDIIREPGWYKKCIILVAASGGHYQILIEDQVYDAFKDAFAILGYETSHHSTAAQPNLYVSKTKRGRSTGGKPVSQRQEFKPSAQQDAHPEDGGRESQAATRHSGNKLFSKKSRGFRQRGNLSVCNFGPSQLTNVGAVSTCAIDWTEDTARYQR